MMRQVLSTQTITNPQMALVGTALQPYDTSLAPNTNASFQNVIVQGNYAYVASTGGDSTGVIGITLSIYNIANPAMPFLTGYITTGSVPWVSGTPYLNGSYQMAINGNYLYVFSSGSSYLYVVNIANPYNPYNISRLLISNSPGSLYGGCYSNGYCYISTQNKGLTVVDVSNPLSPIQVYQEGGTTNKSIGVCVYGKYLFTTNYQTASPWTVRYLKTWDISTPTTPSLLNTYTLPAGTKPAFVTAFAGYAYVSDLNTSSVQICDISNPASPVYKASMQASATFNVTEAAAFNISFDSVLGRSFTYISSGSNATYGGAIDFFEITNPLSPVKLSTLQQGQAHSVFGNIFIANNLIYAANYGVGGAYNSTLNIYSTQSMAIPIIPARQLLKISGQLVPGSGAAGAYSLQGSNEVNPMDFSDIPGCQGTLSNSVVLIPEIDLCYENVRLAFTNTGSGNLSVSLKGVGF